MMITMLKRCGEMGGEIAGAALAWRWAGGAIRWPLIHASGSAVRLEAQRGRGLFKCACSVRHGWTGERAGGLKRF